MRVSTRLLEVTWLEYGNRPVHILSIYWFSLAETPFIGTPCLRANNKYGRQTVEYIDAQYIINITMM